MAATPWPGWRRVKLGSKNQANVGDAYRTLADLLLGFAGTDSGYALPDNLIFFNANGATVQYGAQPDNLSTTPGAGFAAGSGVGVGTNGNPEAAWDLAEVWVRNTSTGSTAVVVLLGPIWVRV